MQHLGAMWRYAATSPILRRVSRQGTTYDEKNIRRRVYDALNVLMAMDIITKDRKEISWRGLPSNSKDELEALRVSRLAPLSAAVPGRRMVVLALNCCPGFRSTPTP